MFYLGALRKYREVNGRNPMTIVVYRDGIGDGQVRILKEYNL